MAELLDCMRMPVGAQWAVVRKNYVQPNVFALAIEV
jgi:hypothetical protein